MRTEKLVRRTDEKIGIKIDDPPPVPADRLDGCGAAFDLVYAPGETAWVRFCRLRGLAAADGRGVVWIANRPNQAEAFDRVVVMQAGRVVAQGKRQELESQGGLYSELMSQA